MKNYVVTIIVRDGEYEYTDVSIQELTEAQVHEPKDILMAWGGFCDKTDITEVYPQWYKVDDYRHFQVYSTQEIQPEHTKVLHSYGIY